MMNQKNHFRHTCITLFISLICCSGLTLTALGAEGTSGIMVCGSADTDAAQENVSFEAPGSTAQNDASSQAPTGMNRENVSFESPGAASQENPSSDGPGGMAQEKASSEVLDAAAGKAGAGRSTNQESNAKNQGGTKGKSLGIFETSGYCSCNLCCSGGWTLTYSGTVPKAGHTISADTSLYPIGTRLMIDGVIYTVEDIGGQVKGNRIDIYYDNHEDAVAHGLKQQEVFAVNP